jgi:hypothetical protein
MLRAAWFLVLLLAAACSHGTGKPVRQADGGYSLSCTGALSNCLHHAEHLCGDEGYTVAEARDVRRLVGHEAGQSQLLIAKSDATVYCGTHAPRPPIELKREPVPPAAPAPPASANLPAPACVPGATQACIGPAGCSGGQACAADGTRYEPCNCGPTTAPAAAP